MTTHRSNVPRDDTSGRDVIAFTLALLAVLVGAGILLLNLPPRNDELAGGSPSPSGLVESASPGSSDGSPLPGASATPGPSVVASPSPTSSEPQVRVAVGEQASVEVNGRERARITIPRVIRVPVLDGQSASGNREWFAAEVTIAAVRRYNYDEDDWVVLDTDGATYERAAIELNGPLGSGRLNAGRTKTGFVAFQVPRQAEIERLQLLNGEGAVVIEVTVE